MQAERGEEGPEGITKSSWYVAAKYEHDVDCLINLFYMTHHWTDDVENREGFWWIPYDTEEACRTALGYLSRRDLKYEGFKR